MSKLLKEDGGALLKEDGFFILLEFANLIVGRVISFASSLGTGKLFRTAKGKVSVTTEEGEVSAGTPGSRVTGFSTDSLRITVRR